METSRIIEQYQNEEVIFCSFSSKGYVIHFLNAKKYNHPLQRESDRYEAYI
jgi:hypothetical protein